MSDSFLRITASKWKSILYWDFLIAAACGILVSLLPDDSSLQSMFQVLTIAQIGVASGVLGFTLTGMSIMTATMDDDMLVFFDSHGDGIYEDLWPFWFTATLAVIAVLCGLVSVVVFSDMCHLVRRISVGVVSLFVCYSVVNVLLIFSYLAGYARDRAKYLRMKR
ncbi:MAG: hypothetical protein OXG65_09485 [Chloroflexi bacterium]|nr:hypothetical protein [Chloroflexota bacterium]